MQPEGEENRGGSQQTTNSGREPRRTPAGTEEGSRARTKGKGGDRRKKGAGKGKGKGGRTEVRDRANPRRERTR